MTQTIDEVRTHREGSIFEIVLNRPKAKNALSVAMYDALAAALAEARGDDSVLVVFLRGEGGNFTSGNASFFCVSARNLSTPHLSMRYFRRAFLRSVRSPCSLNTRRMAAATATDIARTAIMYAAAAMAPTATIAGASAFAADRQHRL